ncbi:MAG: hypothetical protein ABJX32_00910 [Tateyamaria sp.]|uniref:hypothetical protein n=1 Tax=Tateyamaria sp. TaxID=1929288 RepID=UPI00329E91D5
MSRADVAAGVSPPISRTIWVASSNVISLAAPITVSACPGTRATLGTPSAFTQQEERRV